MLWLTNSSLLWAGVAGCTAVGLEFAFRAGVAWLPNLWWIAPLSLLVNFSVYRLLTGDTGWLFGIVLFGGVTAIARIGLTFLVFHEPVTPGSIIAGVALVVGAGARLFWR